MKYFLSELPPLKKIAEEMKGFSVPPYREVNCHIHTPYSFSVFLSMDSIFRLAHEEEIAVIGINDFFITDGYEDFLAGCRKNRIFPLLNLGFTGLLKNEKQKGIRVNDRNSPGKVIVSGKGLDFPFSIGFFQKRQIAGALKIEPEKRFSSLELNSIIKIITSAGGIPCYPVLLDDHTGNMTEFEASPEKLHESLQSLGIGCLEFFPRNNNIDTLTEYVRYFDEKDYIITFGSGYNSPDMKPLTVSSGGSEPLDNYLKEVAWEGACVIAAHQYLRADGRQGYVLPDGKQSSDQKSELAGLGRLIIEYYLSRS